MNQSGRFGRASQSPPPITKPVVSGLHNCCAPLRTPYKTCPCLFETCCRCSSLLVCRRTMMNTLARSVATGLARRVGAASAARWAAPAVSVSGFNMRSYATKAVVQKPAPDFTATAVVDGEFKEVKLSDYKGKYVVLFFYPLDFTFVCPTEIIAFNDAAAKFKEVCTCPCNSLHCLHPMHAVACATSMLMPCDCLCHCQCLRMPRPRFP